MGVKAELYGMTELEFAAMQEKHRREAETIKAGIKARKMRLRKIMRCGEAAVTSSLIMEGCTVDEAVQAVELGMQQAAVQAYLNSKTKEGR